MASGTRKARVSAAEVLRAPEWPCPGRAPGGAPSEPKMAQNHQKRAPVPPWGGPEGSLVEIDGKNQLGYCSGLPFGRVWSAVLHLVRAPRAPRATELPCVSWSMGGLRISGGLSLISYLVPLSVQPVSSKPYTT